MCVCARFHYLGLLSVAGLSVGLLGTLLHPYPYPVKIKMEGCGDGSGGKVRATFA